MPQQAVILTPAEYARLEEGSAVLDELVRMTIPEHLRDQDVAETVAIAFSAKFDPARAEEWGHVSYCFIEALRVAIQVAGQEARKRQ